MTYQVAAGAVVVDNSAVLLVRMNYGPMKGLLALPGGLCEPGEVLEESVVREVREETGLEGVPRRIVGVRSGARESKETPESNMYVAFQADLAHGRRQAAPDGKEVSDAVFVPIAEALSRADVVGLAQEMIRSTLNQGGLSLVTNPVRTTTSYRRYCLYVLNG